MAQAVSRDRSGKPFSESTLIAAVVGSLCRRARTDGLLFLWRFLDALMLAIAIVDQRYIIPNELTGAAVGGGGGGVRWPVSFGGVWCPAGGGGGGAGPVWGGGVGFFFCPFCVFWEGGGGGFLFFFFFWGGGGFVCCGGGVRGLEGVFFFFFFFRVFFVIAGGVFFFFFFFFSGGGAAGSRQGGEGGGGGGGDFSLLFFLGEAFLSFLRGGGGGRGGGRTGEGLGAGAGVIPRRGNRTEDDLQRDVGGLQGRGCRCAVWVMIGYRDGAAANGLGLGDIQARRGPPARGLGLATIFAVIEFDALSALGDYIASGYLRGSVR